MRAAYTEAAKDVLRDIRVSFPKGESGLTDDEITIVFFVHGFDVGTWRKGKFILAKEMKGKFGIPDGEEE